jgi:hypothetical protein
MPGILANVIGAAWKTLFRRARAGYEAGLKLVVGLAREAEQETCHWSQKARKPRRCSLSADEAQLTSARIVCARLHGGRLRNGKGCETGSVQCRRTATAVTRLRRAL